MAARRETIALSDRVAWLRAAFAAEPSVVVSGVACDAPVDYGDATVWAAQVAVMRAAAGGRGVQQRALWAGTGPVAVRRARYGGRGPRGDAGVSEPGPAGPRGE